MGGGDGGEGDGGGAGGAGVRKKKPTTKAEKRRQKRKAAKQAAASTPVHAGDERPEQQQQQQQQPEVEYVTQDAEILLDEAGFDSAVTLQFKGVFEKFKALAGGEEEEEEKEEGGDAAGELPAALSSSHRKEKSAAPTSVKQKKQPRLSVAELKQAVSRPDVVEAHDVTSLDPKLLVWLKALPNSVPVPRHWCHKRKYLQGKRGIEKKPFELPDFIAMTGISKLRDSAGVGDEEKTKTRMRDRVQPKMGRIDIDYQVLHDAFFKFQTKPKLSGFGDLYYEGKEMEVTSMREMKPGQLSEELREALGIPIPQGGTAAAAVAVPPPWLTNMQRYGPPPAYPYLRIPGLNAPIPKGASFGFHSGGWGKPPVDELGNPLYGGDVFGVEGGGEGEEEGDLRTSGAEVDKSHWGELDHEEEEQEEEEEFDHEEEEEEDLDREEEDSGGDDDDDEGLGGHEERGEDLGHKSTAGGDVLDLRKANVGVTGGSAEEEQVLFKVIGETKTSGGGIGAGVLFGAEKTYDVTNYQNSKRKLEKGEGEEGEDDDKKKKAASSSSYSSKSFKF